MSSLDALQREEAVRRSEEHDDGRMKQNAGGRGERWECAGRGMGRGQQAAARFQVCDSRRFDQMSGQHMRESTTTIHPVSNALPETRAKRVLRILSSLQTAAEEGPEDGFAIDEKRVRGVRGGHALSPWAQLTLQMDSRVEEADRPRWMLAGPAPGCPPARCCTQAGGGRERASTLSLLRHHTVCESSVAISLQAENEGTADQRRSRDGLAASWPPVKGPPPVAAHRAVSGARNARTLCAVCACAQREQKRDKLGVI